MGEWDFGNSSGSSKIKFYGVNTYLLISKGNLDYDVIEILDIPNQSQFNINIFDWDFDGLQDLLVSGMSEGIYYKNMGNNKFEKKTLAPLFKQGNYNKYDYDKDGNLRAANSWADGGYLITPKAWKQMIEYSDTAAIGLMGNKEAVPVDWYNNSPYYKMRLKPE